MGGLIAIFDIIFSLRVRMTEKFQHLLVLLIQVMPKSLVEYLFVGLYLIFQI